MEKLQQIVNSFEPITLGEMDGVKLQDRTDTKFVFNIALLDEILEKLKPNYRMLDVNGVRFSRYESLYYDTPEFELYLKHHAGKMNRHKVRYRRYVDSNLHFFEIKFKSNRDRTVKTRIKRKEIELAIEGDAEAFLKQHSPYDGKKLQPQIWIDYTRLTLVSKKSQERLTFDLRLRFRKEAQDILLDKMVIAELKQERAKGSEFKTIMKEAGIREGSISKYCFGINSTIPGIKKNNFKPKVLRIEKIIAGL